MEQKLQQKYEMKEQQLKQEYEDKMRFVYTKVMIIYSSQYNGDIYSVNIQQKLTAIFNRNYSGRVHLASNRL